MTAQATTRATEFPNTAQWQLDVTGMDCGDCAKTIEASLSAMRGVDAATVHFARGTAEVAYDPTATDRAAITDRVKALGYGVRETAPTDITEWIFDVTGMDCGDCAKTIEAGVRRLSDVASASINFGAGTLAVTPANDRLTRDAVTTAVEQAGYRATPRDAATPAAGHATSPWWRSRRVIETALAALLWLIGFGLERAGAPRLASALPFLGAMVLAGYPVARAGWYALRRAGPT